MPEEKFIWLRNAGNIITGPMSSTMRSLAAIAIAESRNVMWMPACAMMVFES